MAEPQVLIIGGGISGLSVGWWLSRAGIPCQIWESDGRSGGKLQTEQVQGYLTEQAASILMNFRQEVDQFVDEAGLQSMKVCRSDSAEQNRYLLQNDSLQKLPTSASGMLRSPLWSMKGKLRLATEILRSSRSDENETVSDFIRRRFGPELLEKAMDPFVAGTLASDPDKANAYSVLPRLTTLERRFGSISAGVIAKKLFKGQRGPLQQAFSFSGGMSTLTAKLSKSPGVDIRCHHRVKSVKRVNDGWQVWAETPQGDRLLQVPQLVMATPAAQAANLLSSENNELGHLLRQIRYAPLNLVHLGLDRSQIPHPLDGTGFLTPRESGLHINGNLWLSRLFPNRAPEGKVLLTSYLGGARHPEHCQWDDHYSMERVIDDLSKVFKTHLAPEMVRVVRHTQALPLYHGHYYAICRQLQQHSQTLGSLHLAANYIGGVSIRDRILKGHQISNAIQQQLSPQSQSKSPNIITPDPVIKTPQQLGMKGC
ncbi:MAG: protoporphyrinogen oxidase [Motiliproteus sp.]|nr:protoporphyrinogen oxidase [Motiliproteus sp.]MCW9051865.1 protoporphyrinogen oxidase [Motiliproteus sp.]